MGVAVSLSEQSEQQRHDNDFDQEGQDGYAQTKAQNDEDDVNVDQCEFRSFGLIFAIVHQTFIDVRPVTTVSAVQ
jgi:hypothetical protein